MASLQRQHNTLNKIIEHTSIKFICPECLRGFPRAYLLYRHFREQQDDTHKGLSMRNTDHQPSFYIIERPSRPPSLQSSCQRIQNALNLHILLSIMRRMLRRMSI
ncbi:hypothetical protein BDV37DRAFT_264439 [Aspergillus pseudonomiae]|uniref:C2H2-type domain-containing protein n=1 Tax=Aspergillus pseudonomiae TaxID=1506151 RepID=A0A5N7CWM1_9EURO|nr:uncharacterized protein BDV37DRAFT_264439 [Aspergillus pseudonomiae]KAE8397983.1 hypothetical protein BDV37DRAFT_264439 [Aspergillus pseudonomiae]